MADWRVDVALAAIKTATASAAASTSTRDWCPPSVVARLIAEIELMHAHLYESSILDDGDGEGDRYVDCSLCDCRLSGGGAHAADCLLRPERILGEP